MAVSSSSSSSSSQNLYNASFPPPSSAAQEQHEHMLSGDPNYVSEEINRMHTKVYHLTRTNREIRENYWDDADCREAFEENKVTIEREMETLFVYFKLFQSLKQGRKHDLQAQYAKKMARWEQKQQAIAQEEEMERKKLEQQMDLLREKGIWKDESDPEYRANAREEQQSRQEKKKQVKKDDKKEKKEEASEKDGNGDEDFIVDEDGDVFL